MIFTRRDLEEKLGFNENERKVIMKFQKQLPILTSENDMKVDARELHNQLGVGRDFTTWMKSRISKYNFQENEDYEVFTKSGENLKGGRPSIEYLLTLDMAKELCMVENNENGKIARKYFILIEKAIKEIIRWKRIREPEKEGYKIMCKELDRYFQRVFNKRPKFYDYSNEADALNLICLGARAKNILDYFDTQDKLTREHLLSEYNMYLSKIQELNIMYLRMNIEKSRRYDLIKQGFRVTFPYATFVVANNNEREVM